MRGGEAVNILSDIERHEGHYYYFFILLYTMQLITLILFVINFFGELTQEEVTRKPCNQAEEEEEYS